MRMVCRRLQRKRQKFSRACLFEDMSGLTVQVLNLGSYTLLCGRSRGKCSNRNIRSLRLVVNTLQLTKRSDLQTGEANAFVMATLLLVMIAYSSSAISSTC